MTSSSGRVTLTCWCGKVAAFANFFRWDDSNLSGGNRCDGCADEERATDDHIRLNPSRRDHRWIAWTSDLINPGICSEDDILAVECAIDALMRLLRRDAADVARLIAAGEVAAGRYYERCSSWHISGLHRGLGWSCSVCNGSGLVLRRRPDGTAYVDEIDGGRRAA